MGGGGGGLDGGSGDIFVSHVMKIVYGKMSVFSEPRYM